MNNSLQSAGWSQYYLHMAVVALYVIYILQIPPIFVVVCFIWSCYNYEQLSRFFCTSAGTLRMQQAKTTVEQLVCVGKAKKVDALKPILSSGHSVLTIANAYTKLDKKVQLPSTHLDIGHMQTIFSDMKQKSYLNLSASDMDKKLCKFMQHLNETPKTGCIFFSMHGTGGSTTSEALVGEDGGLLKESRLAEIIAEGTQIPLLVIIIDACNSGGILNLPHVYTIAQGNQLKELTHKDHIFGTTSVFDPPMPCLVLSAAQETQFTEAYTSGSLFTMHLARAADKKNASLWNVISEVRHGSYNRRRGQKADIDPVISFNDSFAALFGAHKSHKTLLEKICLRA